MAEDRFANVFTAELTLSAANTLTFAELNFGITLRDRVAIVIDELYYFFNTAAYGLMTTAADVIAVGITVSDQVTDISDMGDRRILSGKRITRVDFGTAASGGLVDEPFKESFSPPLIALPNRLFLGMVTAGLAATIVCQLRMHFRTVTITQDQQLIEVLESFQLST